MGEAPSRAGRARQSKAVGRRYRGGTSGAGPVRERTPKPSASLWARFRYRLDNALSRGAWVVIGYLGLVTLAIVLLAAVITVIAHLIGFGGGGQRLGVLESFWQMLVRVVDAGSFASDATWPTRLLALLVTLAGIFIAGSLIGLISSAVDQRVDALRRGRSNVLEHGHTLILGWSARVPTIVGELVVANESERRSARITMADRRSLSFATTSSPTMVGTRADHPRISVWPCSSTLLRPRRSASTRWSTAEEISPMRLPAMKIPARVTRSASNLVGHVASDAKLPASTTRTSICQNDSRTPSRWPPPPNPMRWAMTVITAASRTMASVTSPR